MDQIARAQSAQNATTVHRKSDRELIITRIFDAPVSLMFEFRAHMVLSLFRSESSPVCVPGRSAQDMELER